jgi:predicted O-methyltransferase YrrM
MSENDSGGISLEELINIRKPILAEQIQQMAAQQGFTMSCDDRTGNLVRLLISTKPNCTALELGTGAGYSTTWLLDGMDEHSVLYSVEADEQFASIAQHVIRDSRVKFHVGDGGAFIEANRQMQFDFIFADTWPGKFYLVEEVLDMIKPNGIYIIDDLLPQPNWPNEHLAKVDELVALLDQRNDCHRLKLDWSSGIMILTKKNV